MGELDDVSAQCATCEEQPTAEPLTQRMRVHADGRLHHLKDDVVDVRQDGLLEFLTSAKLAEDRIRANAVGFTRKLDAEIDGGQMLWQHDRRADQAFAADDGDIKRVALVRERLPRHETADGKIRVPGHRAGLEQQAILRERHALDVRAQPFLGGTGKPNEHTIDEP